MSGDRKDDEPFLQRWSRRKGEVRRGAGDAAPPEPSPVDGDDKEAALASLDERVVHDDGRSRTPEPAGATTAAPKPLTEEDFADVDFGALDYNSDYSRFLENGVPESIRQKALGKLWMSDPMFTQVDPFQDYAGDYTDAARAVPGGLLKTAYKVGQGFLSDAEAAEWDNLGKRPSDAAPIVVAEAVVIAREDPDQPVVLAFLAASDAYMATLYPAESNHLVDVASLQKDNVRFLVARHAEIAVGCGAIVIGDDGAGEIKRMWIDPRARGLKLGARILTALEDAAKQAGCAVLRLETGISQPEALALYRRAGFVEIGPFGAYKADPLSVFMEKRLDGAPPGAA